MARRGNGEGTINERKDGRWEARISFIGPDGANGRRTMYGKTRIEVARKLRDAQRRLDQNQQIPPENISLGSHLTTWLETKRNSVRPNTWRRYDDYCRLYLGPELGKVRLSRLNVDDVAHLHKALARRGLSGTTIQHAHNTLKTALEYAARKGLVSRNVAKDITAPRRSTGEMKYLDADGARDVLAAAAGEGLGPFFIVAMTAGLREGELQALRWRDVNLERRRLRVTATLTSQKNGVPVFGEPETQRPRRTVWLTPTAANALAAHRGRQVARREAAAGAWSEYGLVFTSDLGGPLWRSTIRAHWLRLLAKAGLPPMRVHDLRHTAATLLLAQGVPVKVASEMLGHSDVVTTLKVYAHVIEGAQEEAAKAMERLLNS